MQFATLLVLVHSLCTALRVDMTQLSHMLRDDLGNETREYLYNTPVDENTKVRILDDAHLCPGQFASGFTKHSARLENLEQDFQMWQANGLPSTGRADKPRWQNVITDAEGNVILAGKRIVAVADVRESADSCFFQVDYSRAKFLDDLLENGAWIKARFPLTSANSTFDGTMAWEGVMQADAWDKESWSIECPPPSSWNRTRTLAESLNMVQPQTKVLSIPMVRNQDGAMGAQFPRGMLALRYECIGQVREDFLKATRYRKSPVHTVVKLHKMVLYLKKA